MEKTGYVYILANTFHRLYVGMTTDLEVRVRQHKEHRFENSHTARYGIDRLVYFERHALILRAIAREKEIKGWLREKKIALIVEHNSEWLDLSEEWGKPIVYQEPRSVAGANTGILRFAQNDGEKQTTTIAVTTTTTTTATAATTEATTAATARTTATATTAATVTTAMAATTAAIAATKVVTATTLAATAIAAAPRITEIEPTSAAAETPEAMEVIRQERRQA